MIVQVQVATLFVVDVKVPDAEAAAPVPLLVVVKVVPLTTVIM